MSAARVRSTFSFQSRACARSSRMDVRTVVFDIGRVHGQGWRRRSRSASRSELGAWCRRSPLTLHMVVSACHDVRLMCSEVGRLGSRCVLAACVNRQVSFSSSDQDLALYYVSTSLLPRTRGHEAIPTHQRLLCYKGLARRDRRSKICGRWMACV